MDQLLARGEKAFRPGILAEANHNFLYVDEINLLPDHLTDDILDSAASGWHTVEREGFSLTHPARFMLVGTMNPEEGELRPQLLDRLPLSVHVETLRDAAQRVEIAKRNLAFSNDPTAFKTLFTESDAEIRSNIADAQTNLSQVSLPEYQLESVAEMCIALNIDGQRPEIAIAHTAMAMAAYHKRKTVDEADLNEACIYALSHRTRDGGFEPPATSDEITAALDQALKQKRGHKDESQAIQMAATASATSEKKSP
jgi:Mg-chelatase subunit ChlI